MIVFLLLVIVAILLFGASAVIGVFGAILGFIAALIAFVFGLTLLSEWTGVEAGTIILIGGGLLVVFASWIKGQEARQGMEHKPLPPILPSTPAPEPMKPHVAEAIAKQRRLKAEANAAIAEAKRIREGR